MKKRTKAYHLFKPSRGIFGHSAALFCCLTLLSCYKQDQKPNVIFFLVDDLGWTDAAVYGSQFYHTPNIDSLAEKGTLFTNAYASSNVCSPTRASIVTGKYPAALHLTDFIPGKENLDKKLIQPKWKKYLDTSSVTMAKVFKKNGYTTAHVGKWHLGDNPKYWPEHHGFDVNVGGWSKGAPVRNKKLKVNGYFSPYGNPRLTDGDSVEFLTERLTIEAKDFIRKNKNKPFFLDFWFYAVHLPLQAKAEKIVKFEKLENQSINHRNATYAAMIEHVDDAVGKIMNTLKKHNLLDNTIIVFTSDNGGLIGNHHRFKQKITSNYPLRSGKGDNYEGGVRVPCIVYYPKKIMPKVEDTPISSIDFLPTLVDLLELKNPYDSNFDGISLSSLLLEQKSIKKRPLFWHYPHYHTEGAKPYSAIRFGDFKLIHHLEDHRVELFNLSKDIEENIDLGDQLPEEKDRLLMMLNTWKMKVKAQQPTVNPNFHSDE